MILQQKTLETLRNIINEETEYRSGPNLVNFFNELGFNDSYGQGFPSRWKYTDDKLTLINGTPQLDKCIKKVFSPINFIGRIPELDKLINGFNQFIAFDKWKVVRKETEITFERVDKINLESKTKLEINEEDFLNQEFNGISIDLIGLDGVITDALKIRFEEIDKCLKVDASLAVIFLVGSTLEGILLGIASKYPQEFNKAKSSPKDKEGKVKKHQDWSLKDFIDVAFEVRLLNEDVKKFSHVLRDFRNYIHPYQQVCSNFNPDKHTSKICCQVLKAAINQLSKNVAVR